MTAFDDGVRAGMEKVAASIEELQEAYRRSNIIKKSKSLAREIGPGIGFYPRTGEGLREEIDAYKMFKDAKKRAGAYHESTGGLNEFFKNKIKKRRGARKTNIDGHAMSAPGGLLRTQALYPGPATSKAINIAGGIHEVHERRIKPNQASLFGTHRSPKVVFDEHNMLTKMTGKGSAGARDAFRVMRHKAGETQVIRDVVKKSYGKRGWDYIKQFGYTKAMKKDLLRRFKAPDLDLALKVMMTRAR